MQGSEETCRKTHTGDEGAELPRLGPKDGSAGQLARSVSQHSGAQVRPLRFSPVAPRAFIEALNPPVRGRENSGQLGGPHSGEFALEKVDDGAAYRVAPGSTGPDST